MIVIGSDPHKSSFAFAAADAGTGELRSSESVEASAAGFERALRWGRALAGGRVWAIEDCRHLSGRFERFLLARGERVVRVAPKLMAGARKGGRERGKSDPIDAAAVARAALREGVDRLPAAQLAGPELELRVLLDDHDDQVAVRTAKQQRLRWHLLDLDCPLELPAGALDRDVWVERVGRWLARQPRAARVRVARRLVGEIRALTREVRELERELERLVRRSAPQLLAEPGCGPLTAAKLIGEIAGPERFKSDAQLARNAGVAPIPASSGRTNRHRLDRGGNRQLNRALHRLAVNKARHDPDTANYLARKQAEGKTRREALRCPKRHLARHVWQLLQTQPAPATSATGLT
jgi:transposase